MTANGCFQIFLFFAAVLVVTKPIGVFLYRVFERQPTFLDFAFRPIERLVYRVCRIDDQK
jgi:potassium-transporting ATPase potassium-binding subunit